jgi:formiminoglutamase
LIIFLVQAGRVINFKESTIVRNFMPDQFLSILTKQDIKAITSLRDGEDKIGQHVGSAESSDRSDLSTLLARCKKDGVRYVILGIPEDIGSRANLGRGGSDGAWEAFLEYFLNTQSNQFVDPKHILVLGQVTVKDLMEQAASLDIKKAKDVVQLRKLVESIDNRAFPIIKEISRLGFEVIVIGGAHNNSYPIIKGVHQALQARSDKTASLSCINCDSHADFRQIEGRHSGNGFTYAHGDGLLADYYVLGLAEAYNNQDMLDRLAQAGFGYRTYEEIFVRAEISFHDAIAEAARRINHRPSWVGVELDLDSIKGMPTSAESPCGISTEEASAYINYLAQHCDTAYLHLSEGAPRFGQNGALIVGKVLSQLVRIYISSRERRRSA